MGSIRRILSRVTASGYIFRLTFRSLSDVLYSDECRTKKSFQNVKIMLPLFRAVVIFYSLRTKSPDLISIRVGNKPIRKSNYVKVLHIVIDEPLSWKYHTSEHHKTLSRTAGIFFKVRQYISQSILVSFYHSIFFSFLNYGIVVWGGLTIDSYLNPLFLLKKDP